MTNMYLTETQLQVLIKAIKHNKSDFIVMNNNNIKFMSMRNNYILMSIILNFDTNIYGLYEYNDFITYMSCEYTLDEYNNILCIKYSEDNKQQNIIYNISNKYIIETPSYLLYNSILPFNILLYSDMNLRSNVLFEKYISSKVNNILYIDNKYPISLFKGLLPVNKSDKIKLNIFSDTQETFIANFIIEKKDYIIDMYIKYLFV